MRARSGPRAHYPCFVVQLSRANEEQSEPRFGLTVTKKVGNAVARNRIKRRLRACIDALAAEKKLPTALGGRDVVIIARAGALLCPFNLLVQDLEKALKEVVAKRSSKGQKRRRNGGSARTS